MRNKPKWYSILLTGLVFLLASSVIGCALSPIDEETQEILDFTEDILPIIEASNQLAADYNDFTLKLIDILAELHTLQPAEAEALQSQIGAELRELIRRASNIYVEIGQLNAPPSCRAVQYKWKEAYEYYTQGLQYLLSCFATGDSDVCDKSDESLSKANQCVTEAKYELNDIASAHGIEMQWK